MRNLRFGFGVLALAMGLGGCGILGPFVRGSGVVVKETRSFSGFSSVEAHSGFRLDIRPSDAYGVLIEADDNVLPHVLAVLEGERLVLALEPGYGYLPTALRATLTMPELAALSLAGGSSADVGAGFRTAATFAASLSGGSRAALAAVSCAGLHAELSGGSAMEGSVACADGTARLALGGGSEIRSLSGGAKALEIEQSGGGSSDLSSFFVGSAEVVLSGGAVARIDAQLSMNATLSGGSRLLYRQHPGGPAIAALDVSGGSSIRGF